MSNVEAPHGKTHVSSFEESVAGSTGLRVRVLLAPGRDPAPGDRTVASVRIGEPDAGRVVLAGDMTVTDAARRVLEGLGIPIEFLAKDGSRPSGQTRLATIGLHDAVSAAAVGESSEKGERSSVISITGQKRISTLQREFTGHHSHLGLFLFSSAEHAKSARGETIFPLSGDLTIAAVREKKSTEELSIHGRMFVRTLESRIREVYGLYAQVCVMTDAGKKAYTGEAHDGYALSELNRRQQEKGRQPFAY